MDLKCSSWFTHHYDQSLNAKHESKDRSPGPQNPHAARDPPFGHPCYVTYVEIKIFPKIIIRLGCERASVKPTGSIYLVQIAL